MIYEKLGKIKMLRDRYLGISIVRITNKEYELKDIDEEEGLLNIISTLLGYNIDFEVSEGELIVTESELLKLYDKITGISYKKGED